MSGERAGILREYQADHDKLPQTHVLAIDSLMTYMRTGEENDVELGFVIYGSVKLYD
jgi:hypothetical protein